MQIKYSTDLFTDEAIKLIYRQPIEKPMFLMINHIAPHSSNSYDPLQAPKENVNKFKGIIKDENRQKYAGIDNFKSCIKIRPNQT